MFKIMKCHFRFGLGCLFQIYILTQFSTVQDIKHAWQRGGSREGHSWEVLVMVKNKQISALDHKGFSDDSHAKE